MNQRRIGALSPARPLIVGEGTRLSSLWNKLVVIHNDHSVRFDLARRAADSEYAEISQQLENLEKEIKDAREPDSAEA